MAYQSILNPHPVSGPLTDVQLRAATVPVSGTVTVGNASLAVTGTFFQATQPVSGTFFPATQPVSIAATVAVSAASLPLPAGAATETTLAAVNTKTPALGQGLMAASSPVVLASNQSALAVTGTFFQATQPVSGTVTVGNASLAVTGTFFQATQPISGSVSVSNFPATQAVSLTSTTITGSVAVTGTFFQATQPVSGTVAVSGSVAVTGPLTDTQLRLTAVPVSLASTTVTGSVAVTGTFFQATQPVSIATMPSTPVTGTFFQVTQPVSGTVTVGNASLAVTGSFFQATQPVSLASTTITGSVAVTGTFFQATQPVSGSVTLGAAIPAGANVIGALTANQSINNVQIGGVAVAVASGVVGTGVQRVVLATDVALPAGTNSIGTVQQAALTKGTQGATGVSTQDLKDAGRVLFSASTVIAGVTAVVAEALLSMVPTRDGTAAAGATSFAVTAGKRLRITGINVGFISTAAAVLSMRFALRINPAGAAVATSPILRILPVPSGAALIQAGGYADIEFTDGIELSGTQQFGITQIGSAATGTCWVSVSGFEY